MNIHADKNSWESHWDNTGKTGFMAKFTEWMRFNMLANSVRDSLNKYCQMDGLYIEAGCGTSQTSDKINKDGKFIIALDFAKNTLYNAMNVKKNDAFINADIMKMPFKDNSIAGIWNLGVVEHFPHNEAVAFMQEFRRILKPGGVVLLFWPPKISVDTIILRPIEFIISIIKGKKYTVFPAEPYRATKSRVLNVAKDSGFKLIGVEFPASTGFTHWVVALQK